MQQRTLFRARDLAAFRHTLAVRALEGAPVAARRRLVVVPTRAAAELLRRTLESRAAAAGATACLLPDFATRAELLERLADALPERPRLMSRVEREVVMERAARDTARRPRLGGAPFPLRPGLVAAMVDFHDELRRRQRTVRRFAEALFDELRGERGIDRGTDSLIQQTGFLAFAFLAYRRIVRRSGALDEHLLRDALIAANPELPFDHLIVAVADHPSDPRGLWPADFDLIGRLSRLATLDVVITDNLHDAGFRERIERELPGIVEERCEGPAVVARLQVPSGADDRLVHASRDREEELREVVRHVRHRALATGGRITEATAVTFHRPLPYLYLAQQVLTEGRVPYLAFDALPLASEPYAALVDVVLTFARTGGIRESAIELLRSGLLRFDVDGQDVSGRDVAALDTILADRRALGDAATFTAEVDAFAASGARQAPALPPAARRAAAAASAARDELRAFCEAPSASAQLGAVRAFLAAHERLPQTDTDRVDRHLRARAAVHGALLTLAESYAHHDDRVREPEILTAAVRHALESQTFTPRRGRDGVHLVDAVAARFGDFDHVHIVGLVETDWPERPRRSVFYTAGLLRALGWPQEVDHMAVQHAEFADLLQLPLRTLTLHAFQLEGDALVAPSPLVELARDLPAEEAPAIARRRIFDDELLTVSGAPTPELDTGAREWLGLRARRPPLNDPRFSGFVEARPAGRYRVSRVDHYVDCPFRYFAENVLGLPEERDELAGLTPLERGNLVHELFEAFYRAWDGAGRGSITAASLPEAIALFGKLTEAALERFPEADRALERTRLLGSLVAPGVAERVFQLEADDPGVVVNRLLEIELKGPFIFPLLHGFKTSTIEISGKADRIDVLHGGQIRVIDYKLSRLPDTSASIQIAVYAHAARQWLEKRDGRPYTIAEAMYLAFGDENKFEGRLGSKDNPAAIAVEVRAADFAGVIARIEEGRFPAQPRRVGDCQWCRFAGVCRKEYYEGGDEAAEPV